MGDVRSSALTGPQNIPDTNGINVEEIREWGETEFDNERFRMLAEEIARLRRECKSRRKFVARFGRYVAETESLRAQAQNRLVEVEAELAALKERGQ